MNSQENQLEITTRLDETFSTPKLDKPYPHLFINPKNTDPLPVLIGVLGTGDLPILFPAKGKTYIIGHVDKSPLNLNKLLRVYPFDLNISESKQVHVTNTIELMEALQWMQ